MDERRISRRQVLIGAGAIGVLAPLVPVTAFATDEKKVKLLRWDLIAFVPVAGNIVIIPGGSDVGLDKSGDTITMTGSGQAEPHEGMATGGGTFMHQHADGTPVASGSYVVTTFKSFENDGGSLAGVPNLKDDIAEIDETTGGVLTVGVHLVSNRGEVDGILTVNCMLRPTSPVKEGITLSVSVPGGSFDFTQDGGATLFHVLRSDE